MLLLDEPTSALDPIATARIEGLVTELAPIVTIIIVTHNMQQAARISHYTAFMHLGRMVEFDQTEAHLHHAEGPAHPGLHHRPLRLSRPCASKTMTEHTIKAFDADLQELARLVAEMGGLAEKQIADAVERARPLAMPSSRAASCAVDPRIDALQRDIEEKAVLTLARRQPMAIDLREIVSALRIANDLERMGDLAKNIGKRVLALDGEFHPHKAHPRGRAHGRARARCSSSRCSTAMPPAT